jgi:WD40 repeat protein
MPPRAALLLLCLLVFAASVGLRPIPTGGRTPPADEPDAFAPLPEDGAAAPPPPGAVARLGPPLPPPGPAVSLAFAPNGRTLAAGGRSGTLTLWDLASGKAVHALRIGVEPVRCLAFSADARFLSAGLADGSVALLDLAGGKWMRLPTPPGRCVCVLFTPDGRPRAAAVRADGSIRLWDPGSGRVLGAFQPPWMDTAALALSPDCSRLAAGDRSGAVCLWDVVDGRRWSCDSRGDYLGGVTGLAFVPDGQALAATHQGQPGATIWDVSTGRDRESVGDMFSPVLRGFSPDGRLVCLTSTDRHSHSGRGPERVEHTRDRSVRLWERGRGLLRVLGGHQRPVEAAAFSPDGRFLASAAFEEPPRLWELATGQEVQRVGGHSGDVTALRFSPDGGRLTTAGHDGSVQVWNVATGRQLGSRPIPGWDHAFSADGAVVLCWDWERGEHLTDLTLSRPEGGPPVLRANAPYNTVCLAISPDGKTIAAGGSSERCQVRAWAADGFRPLWTSGATGVWICLAFTPDGRRLAAGGWEDDGHVHVWDAATGKPVRRLPKRPEGSTSGMTHAHALAFSPDGRTLAVGGWPCTDVFLWEVESGRLARTLHGPGDIDSVLGLAFNSDGTRLAAADNVKLRIWDVAEGRVTNVFPAASSLGNALVFSPDGSVVAAGGWSGRTLVWDLGSRRAPAAAGGDGPADPDALWEELASEDAERAYRASLRLFAEPEEAVRLLGRRLRPAARPEPARVRRWLADLDSDDFATREQATRSLREHGRSLRAELRRALSADPSPEARRRLEELVGELEHPGWLSAEEVRQVRAAAVLEGLGGPSARRLFAALAAGAPDARLTQEAVASLRRLARRTAGGE